MRLLSVLGASRALGEHLLRHPEQWRELDRPHAGQHPLAGLRHARLACSRRSAPTPTDAAPVATLDDAEAVDALRVEYRRILLRLAARDLAHELGVDDVAAELSDLAAGTLDAALAVARARVGEAAAQCRLAVVAMGKCGGHELNYVSDVDVIFVAEPVRGLRPGEEQTALRTATQLATQLMRVCSDHTGEGTIWPVDAGLRPEGKSGPLVRTIASHRGYYERWAKTWEFQALLKARAGGRRPRAGPGVRGRSSTRWSGGPPSATASWPRCRRCAAGSSTTSRPRRPTASSSSGSAGCATSSSPCSCCSWCTVAPTSRCACPTTLSALAALTEAATSAARTAPRCTTPTASCARVEHRLQLAQLRRTHLIPEDEDALRRLGRSMGYLKDPVAELDGRCASGAARYAGCTRSCSTDRCWTRWRGSRATTSGSRPRRRGPGSPRSATPTRRRRCATSRR